MSVALLSTRNLARRFGGVAAVQDVTLDVQQGELHCVIGPNGAGKSTLLNMLCGTLSPTAGSIQFEGKDIVGLPMHQFTRIGIARKFQVPSVFESLSVRDNLEVALPPTANAADGEARLAEVLDLLLLTPLAERRAGDLAHGQKQWLEIGMALMARPKLLLLDEPTAGMTPDETLRTADLLLSLKGRLTILAIEHDMHFVRALGCRTMVLHQGQLIAQGAFAAIEQDELVRDVYLGRQ